MNIGRDVSIGHQAMLHGCTVGDNTLIGMGAIILNGAVIGKNCIIGANALVKEKQVIPDNSLVVGSPATVIRTLDESKGSNLTNIANRYGEKGSLYFKSLEKLE